MNVPAVAAASVGSVAILMAGVHAGHLDSQAQSPTPHHAPRPTAFEVCVTTLEVRHWFAGDLCDTLRDVTPQAWAGYNAQNGWKLTWADDSGDGCWNTASTTDVPYILCWDGRIKKVSRNS